MDAVYLDEEPINTFNEEATGGSAATADALFEAAFRRHFSSLHTYACSIIKDQALAEEIVQNVFCRLWEKREMLFSVASLQSYLYRSVHNESVSYQRHHKVRADYQAHAFHTSAPGEHTDPAAIRELQQRIDDALNELPEQCRTIFQLSRFEELKYRSIAGKLGISVKTVENQVARAVKLLRTKLAEFLPVLIAICININNLKS